ncbi:MAG: hypothetical protein Ct9H300mP1_38140 [Planctomycetaceae bacterium]|nr:MAG: hypothetical protein Ct9H300mP1_38140 [Planctomycetaceae bacterium]
MTPEPATPPPNRRPPPEPATPEPATPEPATPEPAIPEPAIPEPAISEPGSEPAIPEPGFPQRVTPEPRSRPSRMSAGYQGFLDGIRKTKQRLSGRFNSKPGQTEKRAPVESTTPSPKSSSERGSRAERMPAAYHDLVDRIRKAKRRFEIRSNSHRLRPQNRGERKANSETVNRIDPWCPHPTRKWPGRSGSEATRKETG